MVVHFSPVCLLTQLNLFVFVNLKAQNIEQAVAQDTFWAVTVCYLATNVRQELVGDDSENYFC